MFKILAVLAILATVYGHPLTDESQKDIKENVPKPDNLPALPQKPESKDDSEKLSVQDVELLLTQIIKIMNEKVDKNEELSEKDLGTLGLALLYGLLEEVLEGIDSDELNNQDISTVLPHMPLAGTTENSKIRPKRDTPECKLDNQPGVCVPSFRCDMMLGGPVDDSVLEACPEAMDLCCPFEKVIAKEDILWSY